MLWSSPTTPWFNIRRSPPTIAPIVKVSGFDITGIRVTYTAADDTLSIGLDQPQSGNHPGEVIAGDADNNGNSGTVNPAVTAVPGFGGFQDVPDLDGTEHMGAFLDFTGSGNAQIVAGFSPDAALRPSGQALPGCPSHSRPDRTPRPTSAPSCPGSREMSISTTPSLTPISNSQSPISPSFTRPSPGTP